MLSEFNEKFPKIRKRILSKFVFNVNPTIVTVIGFFSAVSAGFLFFKGNLWLAAIFVILNGFFDILDGEIARKFGRDSIRGDFIDHVFDRFSDIAILFGIAFNGYIEFWLGFIGMVSVLMVSYLGTQAQALSGRRMYSGIAGRADRIILLAVISLGGCVDIRIFYFGFLFLVILSIITAVQRFYIIYKSLK